MIDLSINEAINALKNDDLVIIPTETVYGLAANALSEVAVKKIFKAKGRPQDNPLIVHLSDYDQIIKYSLNQPDYLERLVRSFSPGPLTYVLPKNPVIPNVVTAGLNTAAFRIPQNNLLLEVIQQSDMPLAAPSANRSGRPSATNFEDAMSEFSDSKLIAGGINGGKSEIGIESTVIKCDIDKITILRPGKITKEDLSKVVNLPVTYSKASNKIESPGLKYKHYKPNVDIALVENFNDYDKSNYILASYQDDEYVNLDSSTLYDVFRLAEKAGKNILILDSPELREDKALFDRISRALN